MREKWFVLGFTDFEYNAFQHLDLRNVLGGGLGYHLVETEKTTLDLFGGGDFEQECFSPNPLTVPTRLTPQERRNRGWGRAEHKTEQPDNAERAVCVLSKPAQHGEPPLPV